MNGLAELHSAVREDIPLIVLICNDSSYGAEYDQYVNRGLPPDLSLFNWPDFAEVAPTIGADGIVFTGEQPSEAQQNADKLPEGAVARLGTARLRALSRSIHFSPDGKTLVGVDGGCLVRTWDAASGRLLLQLEQQDYATGLAFAPDADLLAAGRTGSVTLWDLAAHKERAGLSQ